MCLAIINYRGGKKVLLCLVELLFVIFIIYWFHCPNSFISFFQLSQITFPYLGVLYFEKCKFGFFSIQHDAHRLLSFNIWKRK